MQSLCFSQKMYQIFNTIQIVRGNSKLWIFNPSARSFLIEITIPRFANKNYQKCTLGSARNFISSPRYYFSVVAKQYLEDVSLGRFSICLLAGEGGKVGGRGTRGRKEVSSFIGEKGEERARSVFSPHPPREIIDSQRRKWRRKYHVGGAPARFFSPTLNLPLLLPGATFLRCFFSLNPPLFPSRLRVFLHVSTINSINSIFLLLFQSLFFYSFISRRCIVFSWKWSGWKRVSSNVDCERNEWSWNV